jgi:transposase InsO family protein
LPAVWIDDHSRYAISVTAHPRVTGPTVRQAFRDAVATQGIRASTLTDNGMVFTTRLSGGSLRSGSGSRGRNGLEHDLHRLGVRQKNSRPNHPSICGKVHRCLGVHFAYLEMTVVLARLLQWFDLELQDTHPRPVAGPKTKWPASPWRVRYRRRAQIPAAT